MTSTATLLDGRLVRRGDEGYEEARTGRIFNTRRPERYPAAILFAESDDDLVAAVRYATKSGMQVAVRSGGHSWAGWSLHDDVLLVDLSAMRDIEYDDGTGVVSVRPAVRGGLELAPFLTERGRAFPGGHCPSVGLGGFLLQGGQGWNGRSKGWACEASSRSTSSPRQASWSAPTRRRTRICSGPREEPARASRTGHPVPPADLRAARSDVARHMDVRARRRIPAAVVVARRVADARPAGRTRRRRNAPALRAAAPRHTPPPGTVLLLHSTVMADSDGEAAALLEPLSDGPLAARALGHDQGPTTIIQENLAQAAQNPEGHRYAVDCTWTDAPADVLAPLMHRTWSELDTEHSFAIWYGWAPDRKLPDMAFSVEGNVYVATYVVFTDSADDERYRSWVHERTADISGQGGVGVYLGDTDFTRRQDRFLSRENLARLEQIRAERDPDHRFVSYLTRDPAALNVHA